jgi:hypothetical protein
VRDGGTAQRHPHQVLPRAVDTLANRLGHLTGLAETDSHDTVSVSHDHERAEAEAASALHHLGHAVDVNHAVGELEIVGVELFAEQACVP